MVQAQEPVLDGTVVSQSGEDYLRSIRRIDTDLSYFDPTGPAPELSTDQQVDPESPPASAIDITGDGISTGLNLIGILAVTLLIGIAVLFVWYGGGLQVSLRSQSENAARPRGARSPATGALAAAKPTALNAILRIANRREALIRLAQSALLRTVAANDILIQDSWTARDALRRLPRDQTLLEELRALVYDSEKVQFGDRDVTEDSFQYHVDRIRPLLAEATA